MIPSPLPTPSLHPSSSGYRIASSSCATGVRPDRDGQASGTGCARTSCKRGGAKIEAWFWRWSVSGRRTSGPATGRPPGRVLWPAAGLRTRRSAGFHSPEQPRPPSSRSGSGSRTISPFGQELFRSSSSHKGRDAYALGSFGLAILMQPPWPLRFQQSLAKQQEEGHETSHRIDCGTGDCFACPCTKHTACVERHNG